MNYNGHFARYRRGEQDRLLGRGAMSFGTQFVTLHEYQRRHTDFANQQPRFGRNDPVPANLNTRGLGGNQSTDLLEYDNTAPPGAPPVLVRNPNYLRNRTLNHIVPFMHDYLEQGVNYVILQNDTLNYVPDIRRPGNPVRPNRWVLS